MAKTSRYSEKQHELAWKMWRSGKSLREIADSEGMPGKSLLSKWSRDYDCPHNCEFHQWREKQAEIMDNALEEVDKELPDPVERDKERLRGLIQVEEELFELIESGELRPPQTKADAIELIEKILNMNRLIRGESTDIQELRGAEHQELNLQKVLSQFNFDGEVTEDEFIEEVEQSLVQGEDYGKPEN